MSDVGPFADFATRGYAVVPGFLTAAQCAALAEEFAVLAAGDRPNPNFNTRFLPRGKLARYAPRILEAAAQASTPPLTWDRLRSAIFYATEIAWQWDWHTDTSSHYVHPNYLNFWIPVQKPDRARSGLCVVGFDALARYDAALAAQLRGGGSTRVVLRNGQTVFQDTSTRKITIVDHPNLMDELAVTPELGPGDLLLMRHDVFHRTQDNATPRLAVSFRVNASGTVLTRQALMDMGGSKFNNMARMRTTFTRRLATFQVAQRDELSCDEYDAIYDELETRERARCKQLGVKALGDGALQTLVHEYAQEYRR